MSEGSVVTDDRGAETLTGRSYDENAQRRLRDGRLTRRPELASALSTSIHSNTL